MFDSKRNTLDRKYYGRLFVEKEEDVEAVKEIMRELDENEFEYYYPNGSFDGSSGELIAVFREDNLRSVYTGKFDEMDLGEVCIRAWKKGIKCFYVSGKITGFEGDV